MDVCQSAQVLKILEPSESLTESANASTHRKIMEDVCAIGVGGGDRKLKCPRCDSLDTKFCYYNNYNQSQPRHFCKSCRRYWTKGGVLRNVPVGGGIRKTSKRSKPKKGRKSNSHSSSKNSSLTDATITAAATPTSSNGNFSFAADLADIYPDSKFYTVNLNQQAKTTNPSFDSQPIINQPTDGQIFSDIGSISLENMLGFNMADISTSLNTQEQASIIENPSSAIIDQTVHQIEFAEENPTSDGGLAALDWGTVAGGGVGRSGDEGPFDFTGTVDQAYWSDQSLNDGIFHN